MLQKKKRLNLKYILIYKYKVHSIILITLSYYVRELRKVETQVKRLIHDHIILQ